MIKFLRFFRGALGPSFYPPVLNELDLRNRLPRKNLCGLHVLNVGVGSGGSGLARQLPYLNFKRLVNIDIHQPYLDAAQTRTWDAQEVRFIKADIRNFGTAGFDWVLLFDIVEHLPKADALFLLKRVECRQLIFIPLEDSFRENAFSVKAQDHLSLWTEEEFKALGYKTERLVNFHREGDSVFDALWAVK